MGGFAITEFYGNRDGSRVITGPNSVTVTIAPKPIILTAAEWDAFARAVLGDAYGTPHCDSCTCLADDGTDPDVAAASGTAANVGAYSGTDADPPS